MPVERLTCLECQTVLRPAKPVAEGKKVVCPKCNATFLAGANNGATAAAKPKTAKAKAESVAPEPKKPEPPKDDDDGSGGTYGVIRDPDEEEVVDVKGKKKGEPRKKKPEINYAPDMSVKDLRGPAQAAVITPSNILLITGLIGFLGWLVALVLMLIPFLFPLDNADVVDKTGPMKVIQPVNQGLGVMAMEVQPIATGSPEELKKEADEAKKQNSFLMVFGYDLAWLTFYQWYMFLLCLSPIFLGLIYSGIICAGASMIQNLDSRAWGIASSIMVMFPLNAGGFILVSLVVQGQLLGMIFEESALVPIEIGWIVIVCVAELGAGIYMLTVLLQEKVRDGFEFKPD